MPINIPNIPIKNADMEPNWCVPNNIVVASGTGRHIGCNMHKIKYNIYFIKTPT